MIAQYLDYRVLMRMLGNGCGCCAEDIDDGAMYDLDFEDEGR
jgi:hypothetical protein